MIPDELAAIRALRDAHVRFPTVNRCQSCEAPWPCEDGKALDDLLAEVDRLRAALDDLRMLHARRIADLDRALPVIEAARALLAEHTETVSQGYHSWDDPVCRDSESERRPGHHYGWMSACSSCGTPDEYAEPWPCTAHPALRAALAEYDR